jgi:carbonic anhydrase
MCESCGRVHFTRRDLFGAGAAVLAAGVIPGIVQVSAALADGSVNPDEALKRLQDGNVRYVANTSTNKDYSADRVARSLSQAPFAAIVSCADSRVSPDLIFDQGPGSLFIIRVAGNFVNEDGLASLEYGTAVLGTRLILVLGHSACGAVAATIKVVEGGPALPGHLPSLTDAIAPAVKAAAATKPADLLAAATVENVKQNVAYLRTAKPIISDMVAAGTVTIVGGVYDIATGAVTLV